jgi:hypothetical protein
MSKFYTRMLLLVLATCSLISVKAQVATYYTFAASSGTYTPITGGTVVAKSTTTTGATALDDVVYNLPNGTIPFPFVFNGSGFTGLNINSNGYITFGATAPGTTLYTPISGTTGYAGAVAAMANDIRGIVATTGALTTGSNQVTGVANTMALAVGDVITGTGIPANTTITAISGNTITLSANATATSASATISLASGEIRYETVGTAPNRSFVIQYKSFQRFASTNSVLNFQIRLNESGSIDIVYGTVNQASSTTLQVGLRGATNADYNNRTTTTSWASSTAGATNGATMALSATVAPASGQTYTWNPPPPCSGAPVAGTTAASPATACYGQSVTLSLTGSSVSGSGITYQWEQAPIASSSWVAITGANAATLTLTPSGSFQYRVRVTCTTTSLQDISTPLAVSLSGAPSYGTFPFTESFESWSNGCGTSDRPGANWGSSPSTGNTSWRRNDQGSTAAWSSTNGAYSPVSTAGSFSARFHSYDASNGTQGSMDLFLDLSTATGAKYLKFDYINTSGSDVLAVLVSTDGGINFTQVGSNLTTNSGWTAQEFVINSNSATTIIRLRATGDFGFTDIGIDNLSVIPGCAGTPVSGSISTSAPAGCYGGSATLTLTGATVGGGISYQWQSSPDGTTWTNITGATGTSLALNGLVRPMQYRVIVTCAIGGATATTAALTQTVTLPTYATIPYVQSFESWIDGCATTDRPDASWGLLPVMTDSAWRRNDQGASANWGNLGLGAYTPAATAGTYSARFHSYNVSTGRRGIMDLFVNLSSSTSDKLLKFDVINPVGNDSLVVLFSTDGGQTFTRLDSTRIRTAWTTKQLVLTSNSATAVIRFMAYADFGSGAADIGLDNVQVLIGCTSAPAPGTVSVSGSNPVCSGNSVTLNLSGQSAASGIAYQWQSSPDGTTWTDISAATGTSYVASPTTATFYRVVVTCTNTSQSANTAAVQINVNSPAVTSTTPGTRCGVGSVNLQAVGSTGTQLNWFTAATGGTLAGTGSTFATPSISATTTYYVAAVVPTGNGNVTVGAGATTSTSYESPYYHLFGGKRSQYLIRASELIALGIVPGNINSIGFTVVGAGTSYNNFSINMKATAASVMSSTLESGLTNVYTAASVTPTVGVNTYTFTTPFAWDGSSNIIVEVCWSNNNTGGTSATVLRDVTSFVSHAYYRSDSEGPSTVCGALAATATTSTRPQMIFNAATGCASSRTAVTATVTTPPAISVLPASVAICSGQSATLSVTSANTGYTYSWTPGGQTGTPVSVSPTATTKYFVTATDNSGGANNGCVTQDSVTVTVNPLPSAITLTPSTATVCAGTPQQLVASGAGTAGNATIGTGSTGSTIVTPYKGFWGGSKSQFLYTAAELQAQGLTAGAQINSLSFNIIAFASPYTFNGFTIGMKNTSTTTLSTTLEGGLTTVLAPSNYTLSGTAPFTVTHTLTTPFVWDGTSNLLIETCFNNNNGGGSSTNSASVATTTQAATGRVVYFTADNNATVCSAPGTATTSTALPNVTLGFANTVNYTWSPLTNLFLDSAGTMPYTGTGTRDTVYARPTTATTYTATATNTFGCTRTASVTVNINATPVITTQPVAQSSCMGGSATFSVSATGAGLTYQWRRNGVAIAGATGATLNLTNLSSANAGNYDVVVSGTCPPSVTSAAVALTVSPNSWVGNFSADWTNGLNWCGGVPTSMMDVVVPAGTPFQPVINGNAPVNNLTISSGANVTVAASGRLLLSGNLVNNGTFTATAGTIEFRGSTAQTVPAITAANVIMNGAGGVTLGGSMTIGTALTLTNGNITLGDNNLSMSGGTVGSLASHIITNGTGRVTNTGVGTVTVVFPVGANASSYNPVMIANGQGRNYTVGVANTISPAIVNAARAINRTWNIAVSAAVTTPVNITVQYADGDANASATPTANMEVGVHNGTNWLVTSPAGGIAPLGNPAARTVSYQAVQFGPTVVANIGGVAAPTAIPNIDADVTGVSLLPNVVNNVTVLRVQARRTMRITWNVTDMNGRVIMTFQKQVFAGQNNLILQLGRLGAGSYQLMGTTDRGRIETLRFVRL